MNQLINSPLFGIILSLLAFEIGILLYRKFKSPIFNPLLIASLIIIGVLVTFKIDYSTFDLGGKFINMFLGPSTVVLAVPLYKQIKLFKKHATPISIGILIGSSLGIGSIILMSHLIGLDATLTKSLLAKSVTTPIGMEISRSLGGIVPVTVLSIIITGIFGAIVGPTLCKIVGITDDLAVGVCLGTSAHALGTSTALELGETHGAMSSLSIGVAGLMTVFLAPAIYSLALFVYHLI